MRTQCEKTPREQIIKNINEKLMNTDFSLVEFVEPYLNNKSKIILTCRHHGEWEASIKHVVYSGSRCPQCGRDSVSKKKSQNILTVTEKIKSSCEVKVYEFVGFVGEYRNRKSKIILKCTKHGEFTININNFVDSGKGCPFCSETGFKPHMKGFLYALRSESGEFVKIGITNIPQVRIKTLQRRTPFHFNVIEMIEFEKGEDAFVWESIFHKSFDSAGLKGFDGCTEWLKWSKDVSQWLRFITLVNN